MAKPTSVLNASTVTTKNCLSKNLCGFLRGIRSEVVEALDSFSFRGVIEFLLLAVVVFERVLQIENRAGRRIAGGTLNPSVLDPRLSGLYGVGKLFLVLVVGIAGDVERDTQA